MILAAVKDVASSEPVLEHARRLAAADDGRVCALHVTESADPDAVGELAFLACAGFQVRSGDPTEQILRAAENPAITAVVVGDQTVDGTRPGRVTRVLRLRLEKSLSVVRVGRSRG